MARPLGIAILAWNLLLSAGLVNVDPSYKADFIRVGWDVSLHTSE
jgi:hypothetical protein